MRRFLVLTLLLTACSGVSQGEFDELQLRLDETRDELAIRERAAADLITSEAAVAAYANAFETMELGGLSAVYAEGLVFFDSPRRITFRSRRNAIADLESGIEAFGIESQEPLNRAVTPSQATVQWEMRGVINGVEWSFPGVSVLHLDGGLIISETLYYNLAEAPWGSDS